MSACSETYLTSVDVGRDCHNVIWHDAGCTIDTTYTDCAKAQTGAALVADIVLYTGFDASEQVKKCQAKQVDNT